MVSQKIYINIIVRVLILSLTTIAMAILVSKKLYLLSSIVLLLLIVETILLIRYLNQSNRKIAYFFNAVKNEDFTLRFPEEGNVSSLNELHKSLNTLNSVIQKVHIDNQTQQQYFQEILKHAEIGILTFNDKGHILYKNPKIELLLNHSPLNHIKQLQQVDVKLYELFKNLRPFEQKLFNLTNERETIQLAIKSTALSLNNESLTLITIQDIHSELDKKETDSWIKLIRVLTHEIMNSVTPITSISESILGYYKTEDGIVSTEQIDENKINTTAKGLEVIKNQGNDLMSFVQSYRSLLNVPVPDKKIINVNDLIEKVRILMSQQIDQYDIEFEIIKKTEGIEIYADEKQITQILINLCKNAIQSLKNTENGKLTIILDTTKESRKLIVVKDNGPGITPDILDQIFVPFFTTKQDGTGIGLSLSKQIMHLHGGNLTAHSIPNEETSFSLFFE
ncbi:sensor histidine kinase [Aquimarina algicola]|uniref:histidine kinase n=1 Tax=Aquimarina algicola TaxID=2589995 RepID=A0A504JAM9_9FLAO|nr:ATP-binding protein [Aquimarina algicola]TPN88006.1 GHKL domain-containing protein [Aquimarina algicola]